MSAQKFHDLIQKYVQKLERYADRAWYPILIGILAGLDSIFVVIPTDGILVASSMIVPRRWAIFGTCVAVGSTFGAIVLSVVVETQGLPWILQYYPGIVETKAWIWSDEFFKSYGLIVVFLIGLSPLMQQPIAILAAIAHTPTLPLALTMFSGRILKFLLMGWLASHSPKLLRKLIGFMGLKDELKDAGVKIE
jgi:membrane protein YqaA with SNARE-associated domain